jgi:hypothetical protein
MGLSCGPPLVEAVLPTRRMPRCRYAAAQAPVDPAVKACHLETPQVTLICLPGLTHAEAFIRSELVRPEVFTCVPAMQREEVGDLRRRRAAGTWRAGQGPPLPR